MNWPEDGSLEQKQVANCVQVLTDYIFVAFERINYFMVFAHKPAIKRHSQE
jgi:hypothetical protein